MAFALLPMLIFVVNKLIDWLRDLIPDALEPKMLPPASWAAGVVVTYVFSLTQWAEQISVNDLKMSELNVFGVAVLGVVIGAGGSILNDFKPKAFAQARAKALVDAQVATKATARKTSSTARKAPVKKAAAKRKVA